MLATIAEVKARLGIPAYETADDALLECFIRLVSARFENECQRRFARAENAAWDFRADTLDLRIERYPLESVACFYLKRAEASGWEEQAAVDYLVSPARSVIELAAPLGGPRELGRVVYTGGYVLPGGDAGPGQTPLPDDLARAAVEQVAYLHENRNRLGLVSVGGGSGAIELLRELRYLPPGSAAVTGGSAWFKFNQADLLPGVQATLRHYRRLVW